MAMIGEWEVWEWEWISLVAGCVCFDCDMAT